jgi:Domain of unknown function (DUF3471)
MLAYFGLPYHNYSNFYYGFYAPNQRQEADWLKKKKDTIAIAADKFPLAAYTGEYRHDVYGKMNITIETGKLVARFEHHKDRYAVLEYLSPRRFLATFNAPLYGIKEWAFTTHNGKITSVVFR